MNTTAKKILILSANPTDTNKLCLDQEMREIQVALKRANNRSFFEIVTQSAVRVDDLRRALLDHKPSIVHFSGHGSGNQGLALENNLEQTQQDEGTLLRGAALADAEEKLKQRREDLSEGEQEFIQASAALRDREKKQAQRIRRLTVSGLAGFSAITLGLAGLAVTG